MVRDVGWRFMDAGRRIERSLQLLTLPRAAVTHARRTAADSRVLEWVLTVAESIISYRRCYRSPAQLETLLDLLLLDVRNPRSAAYQVNRAIADLRGRPGGGDQRLRAEQRLPLEASTALRLRDTTALVAVEVLGERPVLDALLVRLLDHVDAGCELRIASRVPHSRISLANASLAAGPFVQRRHGRCLTSHGEPRQARLPGR